METQTLPTTDVFSDAGIGQQRHPVLVRIAGRGTADLHPRRDTQRAVPAPRLHAQARGIVDREAEVSAIRSLLLDDEVRLLTLTGPGGVGKTRLAVEVGDQVHAQFSHGVVFVDLSSARDTDRILSRIGEELRIENGTSDTLLDRLLAHLAERKMLLVLDNVEQILAPAAALVERLTAARGVKLLVTSREPLHLRFEWMFPVSPLPLPDPEHLPPLEELAQIPSVALFVQRARAINQEFELTEENARAIAELMVHLDGLPLAIELAAARTSLLSPHMILDRLGQRLSLLRWEAHDLPERQQTLRSAITWSYDPLTADEQCLLRCLGSFVGGFTLEAAEAVAARSVDREIDALEGLASLVEKSLVLTEEDGMGDYRFRLMESVREFALKQAAGSGEGESVRRAHAHYFLRLVERVAPELVGRDQRTWFLRLEQQRDNLRAALLWLWDHGETEQAVRMVTALGYFWEVRGPFREGARALDEALERVPDAAPRLRATMLNCLGSILLWQGEIERPRAVLEEALALGRSTGDIETTAESLALLGRLAQHAGPSGASGQDATRLLDEALGLYRELGNRRGTAFVRSLLAVIALEQRAYTQAERLWQEALGTSREIGDETGAIAPLLFLGLLAGEQGKSTQAAALVREGMEASGRLQDRRALMLAGYCTVLWLAEERTGTPNVPEQLTMLLSAAEALSETFGYRLSGWLKRKTAEATAALQAALGMQRFEVVYREGRSLSFSQVREVIARMLDAVETGNAAAEEMRREPEGTKRRQTLLSPRETDVLHLVAEGLTSKQIAQELIVAESTVRYHLTSLFNKLGVDSRAHAVAVAVQRGLM